MKRTLSPALAFVLILFMLVGCSGGTDQQAEVTQVKVGETISAASKWINSSIDGAIDEATPVNIKDDFYTAVNRDWMLKEEISEQRPILNFGTIPDELLLERKLEIIKGEAAFTDGENPTGIPQAQLKHNEDLLVRFAALASNWDERARLGVEPLRGYVEAIERISSMEEMTDYLLNKDGTNFSLLFPVRFTVGPTFTNHSVNTVALDATPSYTLDAATEYASISDNGKLRMQNSDATVRLLLEKLGYTEQRISRIIKDCYGYEARLAKMMSLVSSASDMGDYLEETDNRFSFSQLKDLQGDFPLTDILAHYGFGGSESYTVTYPQYVSGVGLLYNERYLDEIKAYYMVHTLNSVMPLLDRASFDMRKEMEQAVAATAPKDKNKAPDPQRESENPLTPEEQEAKLLLDEFITPHLGEPLEQIYVARYCTAEQKAKLKALIADIIAQYRVMLLDETWLSVQARDMAAEKLDHMIVRAVYPDSFTDYSALDISACENLVDAVATINAYTLNKQVALINTPVDREMWDMQSVPTTFVNAFYIPSENSINIMAGIMADGFVFNVDESYEEALAKIGMIVGHEITHGFDTQGYLYDKYGYYMNWWTPEDEQTFQLRASRLANYFSGIIPYPGATGYDGDNVKSEAIADMGGVKCMLGIAEQMPDFDYELFFRAYASLWRAKNSYQQEAEFTADVHPLNFLRVNATLQQFEQFYETFDIQPGDGMYLAPEDRVAVW